MANRPLLFTVVEGPALRPFDADTAARLENYRRDALVKCTGLTHPRTLPFQGYYWATLTAIVEATDCAPTADHLHDYLVKASRYTTLICDKNGKPVDVVRDSTAFDAMDEAEFSAYVRTAQRTLAEQLGIAWDDFTRPDRAA